MESGSSVDTCSLGKGVVVTTVDVHQAKNLLNHHHHAHKYLDVRTEEEFKNGYPEREVGNSAALNVPFMFNTPTGRVKNPDFLDQVLAVCGKQDKLVVGCQSGVRSLSAASDLLQADFKHVYNMGGGYLQWVANGYFVNKIPHPLL